MSHDMGKERFEIHVQTAPWREHPPANRRSTLPKLSLLNILEHDRLLPILLDHAALVIGQIVGRGAFRIAVPGGEYLIDTESAALPPSFGVSLLRNRSGDLFSISSGVC